MTHLKRPWCWERLKAGGEGDDRGWDGWMASSTQWTWVWVNSRGWWWTGRPGMLWFIGLQRVRYDWVTKLNWTDLNWIWQRSHCSLCICLLPSVGRIWRTQSTWKRANSWDEKFLLGKRTARRVTQQKHCTRYYMPENKLLLILCLQNLEFSAYHD